VAGGAGRYPALRGRARGIQEEVAPGEHKQEKRRYPTGCGACSRRIQSPACGRRAQAMLLPGARAPADERGRLLEMKSDRMRQMAATVQGRKTPRTAGSLPTGATASGG
jgi:hypothetical protein